MNSKIDSILEIHDRRILCRAYEPIYTDKEHRQYMHHVLVELMAVMVRNTPVRKVFENDLVGFQKVAYKALIKHIEEILFEEGNWRTCH